MIEECKSIIRTAVYATLVAAFLLFLTDVVLPPVTPASGGSFSQPAPPLSLVTRENFVSPFLCADLSYGWDISPQPPPASSTEDEEDVMDADGSSGAGTTSPPPAPPAASAAAPPAPPGAVSLRPRAPGEPFRPVGFPPGGTRTLVLENIGKAGLADRMSNLKHTLLLARFLDANVSVPRPCEALTGAHSGYIPPCEVGWDHYIQSRRGFHGYESGAATLRSPPPPCAAAAKQPVWPLLEAPPAALGGSFCLSVDGAVFPHKPAIRSFVELLAASVWGCDPVADSVDAVEAEEELGYSDAVLRRVGAVLAQYAPARRFGVLHIRRGDRAQYLPCTEVPRVAEAFGAAVRAAGPAAQGLKWFVFSTVYSTEAAYSTDLYTALVATGLVPPGDLLMETQLPELDTEAFGGEHADNYFAMRAMHWFIQHAEVSIRTSGTNDWMWSGEERMRRGWGGGAPPGGSNNATAAAAPAPAPGAGPRGAEQQAVYYLCSS